jgi:hypothetical protein
MIEPDELPEDESSQVTDISETDVHTINAEVVRMRHADAELINARRVDLRQSAAANVKAEHLQAHQSALAAVDAAEVTAEQTAVGYVQAEKATVGGLTGAVVAEHAVIQYGMAAFVAGRDVQVKDSRTVVLLAQNVNGPVTTMFSTRDVLIFGLVSGLFSGLMLLLGRMLSRRR